MSVGLVFLSGNVAFRSDFRAFEAESEWTRLFRSKNEAIVVSVQNALHCCGYNSMRDRAAPFPSHEFDATTCEKTSGFSTHCALLWQDHIEKVEILNMVSGILNAMFMVCALPCNIRYC